MPKTKQEETASTPPVQPPAIAAVNLSGFNLEAGKVAEVRLSVFPSKPFGDTLRVEAAVLRAIGTKKLSTALQQCFEDAVQEQLRDILPPEQTGDEEER